MLTATISAAHAEFDAAVAEERLRVANESINQGRVKEGFDTLSSMFSQLDPVKDKDAYWRTGATLVEYSNQTENHALGRQTLDAMMSSKIAESNAALFEWMRLYAGRNLIYTGQPQEGEKILRVLAGNDARLVYTPPERAAAIMLSTIELDRDNIEQAAIWMRRAVVGTLVDKGTSSEQIVDVLTEYAVFLRRTHRLPDSSNLFIKLAPIYDTYFSHHGPKYIRFQNDMLTSLVESGSFEVADRVLRSLKQNTAAVDIVAGSVNVGILFHDLYQLARAADTVGPSPTLARLKELPIGQSRIQ